MNKLLYIAGRFKLLYRISPGHWLLIMTGFLAIWTQLMLLLYREIPVKQSQESALIQSSLRRTRFAFVLNLVLMLVGLVIILLVTFVRRESSEHRVILIPLRVLFGLKAPRDYWHVTVMNIVLYVPFSCGLCFVIGKKYARQVGASVLICVILALVAEARQYIFGYGLAEMDDVLMNTLGASLGTLPYVISYQMTHRALIEITTTSGADDEQYDKMEQ